MILHGAKMMSMPYLGTIHGLREGSSICIQGSIPENISRFHVNLLCGQCESSDIALHFNPRFDGSVVFNSRQSGSWGSEVKIKRMPFCKGQRFVLVFLITSRGYQVKVNGEDFHLFLHRVPVERVERIKVSEDVAVQTFNVIGGGGGQGIGMSGTLLGGNMGGGCMSVEMQSSYSGGTMGGCGLGGGMVSGFSGSALTGGYSESTVVTQTGGCSGSTLVGGMSGSTLMGGMSGSTLVGGCSGSALSGGYSESTVVTQTGGCSGSTLVGGISGSTLVGGISGSTLMGGISGSALSGGYSESTIVTKTGGISGPTLMGGCSGSTVVTQMGGISGSTLMGGCSGSTVVTQMGGCSGSALMGMGGQVVHNPCLPYQCMISGGLFPERTIVIKGMVACGNSRFKVNFVVSRTNDIAFQINPRISEGVVVRNSRIGGSWIQEERVLNFCNPFAAGKTFDMSIRCSKTIYQVFVNGKHLFNYNHHILDLSGIDRLEIDGQVQITSISF